MGVIADYLAAHRALGSHQAPGAREQLAQGYPEAVCAELQQVLDTPHVKVGYGTCTDRSWDAACPSNPLQLSCTYRP